MTRPYRGRLAPSPTGEMHLGHARTYLVAWLRARQAKGQLVMRIEDIDGPRNVSGSMESILFELEWLGLSWDEGPSLGGEYGSYIQSERFDRYEEALSRLRAEGRVYACTCSRKEIAAVASAPHGVAELGLTYPGTCREGPSHPERDPKWRFRFDTPADFTDEFAGPVDASGLGGDFVVRRADGIWSYQLAVTVDDLEMGITEVVRGDDLLSSTPRQIALQKALGAPPPSFFHVPLVVDHEGRRLSKRFHSPTIASFRESGMTASALRLKLGASLGMSGVSELFGMVEEFDPTKMPRTPLAL